MLIMLSLYVPKIKTIKKEVNNDNIDIIVLFFMQ